MNRIRAISIFMAVLGFLPSLNVTRANAAGDGDWPEWRGPKRNAKSPEKGLLQEWPKDGPPVVWTVDTVGEGYGTVSIQGDRVYVQGSKDKKNSVVFCLDRATGKTIWTQVIGPRLDQDRGPGARSTPTVEEDRVYALSEGGDLACLKASDGSVVWKLNIMEEFKGANPNWHYSESPLVDGKNLIVTPGGPDATIVALDKMTGKTVWTSKGLSDGAGYSSCIAMDVDGLRCITTFTAAAGVGVRASDGKPLWRSESAANKTANIATPIVRGNQVFYTSAYGTGCCLVDLKRDGDEIKSSEVYFNRDMQNHHGGVVFHKGHVFGFSGDILTCMELKTGKEVWKDRSVGKGSLMFADGMLYMLSENSVVGLAVASPKGYAEKGRFRIEDQGLPSWAHPVVCGGKLFIRNQGILTCYDVKDKNAKLGAEK